MDLWGGWKFLQALLCLGAILLAITSIVAVWRLRGILSWKHSLGKELKELDRQAKLASGGKQKALEIAVEHCRGIWQATSLDFRELLDVSPYIRSIAGCFYPDVEKPELRISVRRFLNSAQAVVSRLELILQRPGFHRLQRVRIRHIRQYYEWYTRINSHRLVKFFVHHHVVIKRIFQLHLVILPNPFSWLAYLSNRLTMLSLTRCLMVDLYLFIGKTAIQAYDEEKKESVYSDEAGELEKTLEELDSLHPPEINIDDPRIQEIRNRLVGFSSMIVSKPGIEDWKKAFIQTADIIAEKYFPESEEPLEEALIGTLLARSRIWIKSLCDTETLPVVKRVHRVKIDTLINIKSFTDIYLPGQMKNILKRSWGMYGWMKWPLKVYRWIRKRSPAGIAIDMGWVVAKRGFINFVCRYTFDMAYRELDIIYSRSRLDKEEKPVKTR